GYPGGAGGRGRIVLIPIVAPTLTSLSPTSGLVGTIVTLTGTDFTNASTVSFGGTAATVTYISSTTLRAPVPNSLGAGVVSVTVTTIGGTTNGVNFTVTTAPVATAPTVTTTAPASVTTTGATLGGNVTADGGATITERGVVYVAGTGTPTTGDTKLTATGTTGSYTMSATGLTASTQYTVRAYAINSVGTSYGAAQTFTTTAAPAAVAPTVTTATPASITASSATLGGTVTSEGSTAVTERGVVYVQGTGTPTTSNTKLVQPGDPGTYTLAATGLTASTQYTVRAYAINSVGTSYGAAQTFTTLAAATAATVTTTAPASITTTGATLGGNVTADGGATVTERGVVYVAGTGTPTTSNTKVQIGTGTGSFSQAVTGLAASTQYTVRAYAINSVGTSYGRSQTFTTPVATSAPTVTTTAPASITSSGAILGGNVTSDGNATITERGVVYVAGTGTPTTSDTRLTATGTTGSYTTSATSLAASTQYTVRAYAINSVGTSYGAAQTFTTTAAAAPDLTISTGSSASPTAIPAGTYNSITVVSPGYAQFTGAVVVNSSVTVQSGGSLMTNCQGLTGAGSFTLAAGATLGICDAAGITASGSTGAVRVTGTRSFSTDASYVYNGTTVQGTGLGLPARVRNLTTTNNNRVDLTASTSVAQVLTVAGSGNLDLDGPTLTLLSDASGTALVVNSGTGSVTGNGGIVQRYLDPSRNPGLGYRHYASPVSGNRLSDLGTAGFTPTFNPAYNTSATPGLVTPFPTVFSYDQDRLATASNNLSAFSKGWFSPVATDAMTTGMGYTVNIAASEKVDFQGFLNNGPYSRTLARTSGATAADGGWHLVGNPYPAPLDWSTVQPADRTGLDASMYVYESDSQYGGQYRSYVNNVGGNPLVASSQGFFVRVSSGQTSGTLTFRNSQRRTSYADQVAVRRGAADLRPQLQLALAGNGLTDALHVYAQAGATAGLDSQFDAAKLSNPTGLNLAALAATGEQLAIDGRPAFAAATSIPLFVGVPAAGNYTLTAASFANLTGTRVELVDNLTNTRTALTAGTSYAFTMTGYTAPGRFWLNLTPAAAPLATAAQSLEAQVLAYPNPAHGQLTVLRPAAKAASATLLNSLGQTIRTLALPTAETTVDLRGLAAGVYTLRLMLDGQPVAKRVVID
ncbi:T9SS type A sorting domain-containing protein, partial [Hymenobacter sp. ASUV-10]